MRTDYSTERFRGFLQDLKESFWGEMQGKVKGRRCPDFRWRLSDGSLTRFG